MGTTLYISTDPPLAGINRNDRVILDDLVGDHKSMAELCGKLGVPSLSSFQSYDPKGLAEFIDDKEQLKAAMAKAKPLEWFEPAAALPTIHALIAHHSEHRFFKDYRSRKGGVWSVKSVDMTDRLLFELNDLLSILAHASGKGAKFNLHIGF